MSTDAPRTLEGGCLCGALRYRVTSARYDVAYCHCRLCQRSAGAPAVPWASVPIADFSYVKGAPSIYFSSAKAQREFCGACGTPVVFRVRPDPRYVDFAIVTLDDPNALAPAYHIWRMSRINWFETADNLPRHDDQGPDHYY